MTIAVINKMQQTSKQQLSALLTQFGQMGTTPFAQRVKDRQLDVDTMSDDAIGHNLSMAYGAVLTDLDQLGMSTFYLKDLTSVIGRERARRVLEARQLGKLEVAPPRPSHTTKRFSKAGGWGALATAFAIVFAAALIKLAIFPPAQTTEPAEATASSEW